MITQIEGNLSELYSNSVILEVQGLCYEIFIGQSVHRRIEKQSPADRVKLIIYHYVQTDPSRSIPVLIGFNNRIEREFFEKFITVSGIGPKAALKALSVPIAEIANAIDTGDKSFLKTLPGVGEQRAREIIAKLEGKVGRFGLIQDEGSSTKPSGATNFKSEALVVLQQLQYKRDEALMMIEKAVATNASIKSVEDLLNEVYRQRTTQVLTS